MWQEIFENGHQMLMRRFEWEGFKTALDFVMKVGQIAEEQNHHPDILIEYNVVTIKSWTHDTGMVSQKDKDLVKLIDNLV